MELAAVFGSMLLVVILKGFTSLRISALQSELHDLEKETSEIRKKREAIEAKQQHLEKENRLIARQQSLLENEKDQLCEDLERLGTRPIPESEIDVIESVEGRTSATDNQEAETETQPSENTEQAPVRPEDEEFRILLVDDNDELLTVLHKGLSKDYNVEMAADGFEALTKILKEKQPYDLIITDLKMPNVNGFTLIEHLPEHIPVIVISGFLSVPEFQATAKRANLVAALNKPFKFGEVREAIENVISQRQPTAGPDESVASEHATLEPPTDGTEPLTEPAEASIKEG